MRVPESHADILEKPVRAVLSTFESGGRLRSSLCTCLGEGGSLLITSVDPAQVRQIGLNPKVSVLVVDPGDVDRWLCAQGDASVSGGEACEVSIRRVTIFPM
jgi:general stress protein 26